MDNKQQKINDLERQIKIVTSTPGYMLYNVKKLKEKLQDLKESYDDKSLLNDIIEDKVITTLKRNPGMSSDDVAHEIQQPHRKTQYIMLQMVKDGKISQKITDGSEEFFVRNLKESTSLKAKRWNEKAPYLSTSPRAAIAKVGGLEKWRKNILLSKKITDGSKGFKLKEDAPTNSVGTGNIAGANGDPPGKPGMLFRRKKKKLAEAIVKNDGKDNKWTVTVNFIKPVRVGQYVVGLQHVQVHAESESEALTKARTRFPNNVKSLNAKKWTLEQIKNNPNYNFHESKDLN